MESNKALWKLIAVSLVAFCLAAVKLHAAPAQSSFDWIPDYEIVGAHGEYVPFEQLNETQKRIRIGKEIWYKSTAGNSRFHTYVLLQRMGLAIDWYKVFASKDRYQRFNTWGLMNDPVYDKNHPEIPGCCIPSREAGGDPDCPAQTYEQTYGMDWCTGDGEPWNGKEGLLSFVGKKGYRDPACDLPDIGGQGNRQSACDLEFGTSLGSVGFRKFPNPRFHAEKWKAINGGKLGTWQGYNQKVADTAAREDERMSHIHDGSIEPPFLIGITCASCHISFDPRKSPSDPARPKWVNLDGTVGANYLRISEILGSGMPRNSFEWQNFTHARPGSTDTSAVPNDMVTNPGTMNSIFNFDRKRTFDHDFTAWWKTAACPQGASEDTCWCEPNKPGKCWEKRAAQGNEKKVLHILKGGEDSVGPAGAVQRVYFNIGSCSEQCWLNNLTDFRQIDPQQRNYGQTPFNIGQCRRDCPNFRAIEDRVGDIATFLFTRRPTDLHQAEGVRKVFPGEGDDETNKNEPLPDRQELAERINNSPKYKSNNPALANTTAVDRGREVFRQNCATCHSSLSPNVVRTATFWEETNGVRNDWLGEGTTPRGGSVPGVTLASSIGTYRGRALHSNHMQGHIWQEYGSDTLRARPADRTLLDPTSGGRGYFKNISLLSVWAFAPFMHNNAIGPEVCSEATGENQFYRSPYEPGKDKPCVRPAVSVEARIALFEASMEQLLNSSLRGKKVTRTDRDIVMDLTPKFWLGTRILKPVGVTFRLRAGIPTTALGSFNYKLFLWDMLMASTPTQVQALEDRLTTQFQGDRGEAKRLVTALQQTAQVIRDSATKEIDVGNDNARMALYLKAYSTNTAEDEAAGHNEFDTLSAQNKKDLTAFLLTL